MSTKRKVDDEEKVGESSSPPPASAPKKRITGIRRRRTTLEQLAVLETIFSTNSNPTEEQRNHLANVLEMTPRQVQIWFQNRRAKTKQQPKSSMADPMSLLLKANNFVAEFNQLSRSGCSSTSPLVGLSKPSATLPRLNLSESISQSRSSPGACGQRSSVQDDTVKGGSFPCQRSTPPPSGMMRLDMERLYRAMSSNPNHMRMDVDNKNISDIAGSLAGGHLRDLAAVQQQRKAQAEAWASRQSPQAEHSPGSREGGCTSHTRSPAAPIAGSAFAPSGAVRSPYLPSQAQWGRSSDQVPSSKMTSLLKQATSSSTSHPSSSQSISPSSADSVPPSASGLTYACVPQSFADTTQSAEWPAPHLAVVDGNLALLRFLLAQGVDANVRTKDGLSPLHVCASFPMKNRREIADMLLECGCDANARSVWGMTPLHIAALEDDKNFVEYLLSKGAQPSIVNNEGLSAEDIACKLDNQRALSALREAAPLPRHFSLEQLVQAAAGLAGVGGGSDGAAPSSLFIRDLLRGQGGGGGSSTSAGARNGLAAPQQQQCTPRAAPAPQASKMDITALLEQDSVQHVPTSRPPGQPPAMSPALKEFLASGMAGGCSTDPHRAGPDTSGLAALLAGVRQAPSPRQAPPSSSPLSISSLLQSPADCAAKSCTLVARSKKDTV
mmetsp:Transcript_52378/g.131618  ORF Transcript_52378/g.131618 Transcript_52378/m.131618 type:complete len:667 (-) Transcript_52378:26-2026(-)